MKGEENVLTTHAAPVYLPSYTTELSIHFLGDIHYDSPACDRQAFEVDVAAIKRQHDAGEPYAIVLMGDYLDRCSDSERGKLVKASVHESTQATWDRGALRDITEFLDTIWFAKDHILGVVQGNHYWTFLTGDLKGKSSDAYMAEKLGCKWLGFLSYIRLTLTVGKARSTRVPLDLCVCHGGRGGGKLAGTSINQVDDLRRIFPGASVYAMGHNHQAGAVPASALFAHALQGNTAKGGLDIREKKQLLIRTGSYLKAYEQNTPSYAVRALYKPATLGHAEVQVRVLRLRSQDGGQAVAHDIKAVV